MICQGKEKPLKRGGKRRRAESEGLSTCALIQPQTLIDAATLRQDERLLFYLEGLDAVAADVVYHRSCYKEYTNPTSLKKFKDLPEELTGGHSKAYEQLAGEIRSTILEKTKVAFLPDLRDRFVQLLAEQGGERPTYREGEATYPEVFWKEAGPCHATRTSPPASYG